MKVQESALWAKALSTCVFATVVSLFYISFAVASYPFSDDMESGQGTWTFDEPWAIGEDDSHGPTHSLMDSPGSSYANDIDISVSNVFDLTGSYRPLLTFWHRYNLEEYGDFGYVEVKPIGGDWQKLFFVTGFSGVNWEKVEIDLSEYANTEITLRFRLVTNASVTYDGWYIDDVSISDNTGTASFPFFDDGESGPDNWITSTWGLTNDDYHSPMHSWNEAPDGGSVGGVSSRLTLRGTLDFSGAVNPQLSFWYHRNQARYIYLSVDVSANDGLTWTNVWTKRDYEAPATWSRVQIDLSDYTGLDAVTLRFRMDGYSFYDLWYLDDIRIADGLIEPVVDKGILDRPASIEGTIDVPTDPVYGLVYEPGITDQPGQGSGITAQLGFGPDGSHPGTWPEANWVEASYNGDVGDHDEYVATITPLESGVFDYAFRFKMEGSPSWIYADLDGDDTGGGGENDYSIPGALRVFAPGCEGDFDGDGDVDGSDLAVFTDAFGSSSIDGNYNPDADFNNDGYVDESDLAVFAANFGRTDCPR